MGARNQQNVKSFFSSYRQHFCLILNYIIFSYLSRDNMINYLLILIFCLNYKLKYFGEMSFKKEASALQRSSIQHSGWTVFDRRTR